MDRMATQAGELARRGFTEPRQAVEVIAQCLDDLDETVVRALVADVIQSADPDQALAYIGRLVATQRAALQPVLDDPGYRRRVTAVLGASTALGQHIVVHPEVLTVLADAPQRSSAAEVLAELLTAVDADPQLAKPVADPSRSDDLRLAYRRALLRIAARDLTAPDPAEIVSDISAELADLADATVATALALARGEVDGYEGVRLAVLAMGKTGAQELNYVSDVDVIYVVEPEPVGDSDAALSGEAAVRVGTRLAAALARICSAHTAAGTIWQVDANLRPEGKAGPLVRTLASMRAYYDKWAKNWEFQALLKARPMAGDLALGQEFVDLVAPQVWTAADDPQFVAESQAMRKRVIALLPAKEADLEIKLGAGGLRDTEFTVQLLQLVHGRADERLRVRGTFAALERLVEAGYVGRTDGPELGEAYRIQRVLEHRIQLSQLRRTHLMPSDEVPLRQLARSTGHAGPDELLATWRASTRRVLRLHQRLFYSPLLEAVARISTDEVRLTSEAAETRLRALGFNDTRAALRHIEALSVGFTRQAEIQRQLLPAMLGWFATGPNPDHGLLAFRRVSEALGRTSWYLRALRDEGAMAENLARVLASSRFAVDLLLRAPQTVQLLSAEDGDGTHRDAEQIQAEMESVARRHDDPRAAVDAIRAIRRKELLRVAMADLLAADDLATVGRDLSGIMTATLNATLGVAAREFPAAPRLALIAMGRWGGGECSYSSDADAMVVAADSEDPEALGQANRLITRVRELLRTPGADPVLELDLDLRPEGKGGPMVRTLSSYRAYYERWSSTWEAQALVRAGSGAGDPVLAESLLESITPVRWPTGGLPSRQLTEIRKLKARMESERVRGTDPRRHVKLGPGGLSDVEWTIQVLQLAHAHEVPTLQTPSTLAALTALAESGLVTAEDAVDLRTAWELAARIRNGTMLLRGRASDALPTDAREIASLANLLGYPPGEASVFQDDWARAARRARDVMDRLFWGLE
ncbi:MAG: bifunctional [glutamine synthetase] adenylyltransferase/[glutamine synthetase]-adenylyl-L-tyrosine phosphorylase [Propioniciclava sp.]